MRHLAATLCLTITVLLGSASDSAAQTDCFSSENFAKYQKVRLGQIKLDALSSAERNCIVRIHMALSKSNAPEDTEECRDAWDQANRVRDDVVSAAKRLIRCVEDSNHSDDCYSEARRVRSYHGDYESAVSTVQGSC